MSAGEARSASAVAIPGAEPILAAGGAHVEELLERTEQRLAAIADDGGPALGRHAALTLSAGGKRMRPLLVYLCAGSGSDERLAAAGTAVELLHMATLVHDDVLDRAELRRGRPTVFVVAGREAAAATGDYLFARAFSELVGTGSARGVAALSDASSALARGELMQRADAWSQSVGAERYLERCALKTGRLFAAACTLGGVLGRPGEPAAQALAGYGAEVGLAFQILDDVLDVAGPVQRTGKQRGTDLLDGTVTLPLILARERDPELRAVDLRALMDPAGAEQLCDRIAASGALDEAREHALGHVGRAKQALERAPLAAGTRRALALVADGVVERYS